MAKELMDVQSYSSLTALVEQLIRDEHNRRVGEEKPSSVYKGKRGTVATELNEPNQAR